MDFRNPQFSNFHVRWKNQRVRLELNQSSANINNTKLHTSRPAYESLLYFPAAFPHNKLHQGIVQNHYVTVHLFPFDRQNVVSRKAEAGFNNRKPLVDGTNGP